MWQFLFFYFSLRTMIWIWDRKKGQLRTETGLPRLLQLWSSFDHLVWQVFKFWLFFFFKHKAEVCILLNASYKSDKSCGGKRSSDFCSSETTSLGWTMILVYHSRISRLMGIERSVCLRLSQNRLFKRWAWYLWYPESSTLFSSYSTWGTFILAATSHLERIIKE